MSTIRPVITLYQPWASWILLGWKKIETRTHARFRSLAGKTIAIHAGLQYDKSDAVLKNPWLTKKQIKDSQDFRTGEILGIVHVDSFDRLCEGNSHQALIDCSTGNRFGLFLSDPKILRYEPIPVKGERGIWYFDFDNMEKIKKREMLLNTKYDE